MRTKSNTGVKPSGFPGSNGKNVPKENRGKRGSNRKLNEDAGDGTSPLILDRNLTWVFLTKEQTDEVIESDVDTAAVKLASFLGLNAWKEDLQSNIILGVLLHSFISAKEYGFSAAQVSAYVGMVKATMDRSTVQSQQSSIENFQKLLSHHVPSSSSDSDGLASFLPTEMGFIIESFLTGFFQHHRLFQYVLNLEQDKIDLEYTLQIDKPRQVPPLSEAITLEAYEAEQQKLQLQEREEAERKARLEEEQAGNPFSVLASNEIRAIAMETITELIQSTRQGFDAFIDEQATRQMSIIMKLTNAAV
ncbi:hypothetical protein DFJ73DRAFT_181712 [Zopfochytrium polystomum]|nr:hypothetical protein DFJ73DRAFT_181712 [Zopfochytrium polystomum]